MALKHYGGSVPKGPAEWTCPSCGAENTVPLKAGCQKCGAGADARKVELPVVGPETAGPAPRVSQRVVDRTAEGNAALAWMRVRDYPEDQVSPFANSEDLKEAFMAGVAWAQANAVPVRPGDIVLPHDAVLYTGSSEEAAVSAPLTLWTDDGKHQDPLGEAATATILAALAFYRDNQLGYGAVPGQLTAEQVTALIARLSPPVEEPGA